MEYACNTRAGRGLSEDCSEDAVVKLRGLPYDSSKMQIAEFFQGRLLFDAISDHVFPTFEIDHQKLNACIFIWERKI